MDSKDHEDGRYGHGHAEAAAVVDPTREEDETLLTRVAALHHVAIGIGTLTVLNPQKTRNSHSL